MLTITVLFKILQHKIRFFQLIWINKWIRVSYYFISIHFLKWNDIINETLGELCICKWWLWHPKWWLWFRLKCLKRKGRQTGNIRAIYFMRQKIRKGRENGGKWREKWIFFSYDKTIFHHPKLEWYIRL